MKKDKVKRMQVVTEDVATIEVVIEVEEGQITLTEEVEFTTLGHTIEIKKKVAKINTSKTITEEGEEEEETAVEVDMMAKSGVSTMEEIRTVGVQTHSSEIAKTKLKIQMMTSR